MQIYQATSNLTQKFVAYTKICSNLNIGKSLEEFGISFY